MTVLQPGESTVTKPLRLWPGVVVAALMVLTAIVVPLVVADGRMFALMGGVLGGLVIFLWWIFFSRVRWSERLSVLAVMIAGTLATSLVVHESIRTGMMGMMLAFYSIPVLSLALVIWAVSTRHLAAGPRRAALAAVVLIACAIWTLVRTDGVAGDGAAEFKWRWMETAEERLLAQTGNKPAARVVVPDKPPEPPAPPARNEPAAPAATPVTAPVTAPPAEPPPATAVSWPGFRGAHRDGVTGDVRIRTDWAASPPVELWRRAIGPGWSSFAVRGDFLYTQEQRGENEIVACYRATSGEPVWVHTDSIRFWESNGGAGPRATPTVSGDRVYAMGATGLLNALDAATGFRRLVAQYGVRHRREGSLLGHRELTARRGGRRHRLCRRPRGVRSCNRQTSLDRQDSGRQLQLAASRDHRRRRPGPAADRGGHDQRRSSRRQAALGVRLAGRPHRPTRRDGRRQRARYHRRRHGRARCAPDSDLAEARRVDGRRALDVAGLKPYFNDFVVHKGHAFGFDGRILSCINLEDGQRKWKGGGTATDS